MEEEGGFGLGPRGWSSGALAWPPYGNGSNGGGYAPALLPPPPAEAPAAEAPALAERWRAALGLPQIEASPSPPPPPLLRTGSALLLPHSYGSFDSLFAPLSMEPPPAPLPYHSVPAPPPTAFAPYGQPQGFDYGAQVCNTPTAAAALSALGGRRAQATPATAAATAGGDEPIATEVICNGMLGQLLLKAPPLRIRVAATGEVLGPLDFERVAGVLSKKWRHTVHVPSTGQTLGEWLDARGMGHLTARGVPTPPAYAPPRAHAAPRPRPLPAHPTVRRGGGAAAHKFSRRAGYGADAWATGAELGSEDDDDETEEDDEDEMEEEWRRRRRAGGGSDSEEFSPAARRRAAARRAARAARFARGDGAAGGGGARPASRGRKRGSDDGGSEDVSPRRRAKPAAAGAKAGLSSRVRMMPAAEPGDAATAWAYAAEAPLCPRDFLRLAPLRRVHELRAAERAAPVALSRVLCGDGMALLSAADVEAELAERGPPGDDGEDGDRAADVAAALAAAAAVPEALRDSTLPVAARSRGGYRSALASHGLQAGAFYAEVALPRLPRRAAARLGWAPDSMPLNGPVGAAAAASGGGDEAEPACAGVGVRGATGQTLRAGRPPGNEAGPTFGQGDTVGMYVYQPPADDTTTPLAAPRDVVALARASARCGLFVVHPPQPDASLSVPGSAVLYRVNGGDWALAARDCLPRRPLHLAISLYTDAAVPDAPPAVALLNPGPHFAFPPPSAEELSAAVAAAADADCESVPMLRLPPPRALCELGPCARCWAAQREAAEAPAEPEGEDDEAGPPAQEAPPEPQPATGANIPSAKGDAAALPSAARPDAGACLPNASLAVLLASAAAAAAARLGLAAPQNDADAGA